MKRRKSQIDKKKSKPLNSSEGVPDCTKIRVT